MKKRRNNNCKYMKIIYVHCGWRNEYRSDPHSYKHYWISSWNKAWKKFRPVQDLNPWPHRYRKKKSFLRWWSILKKKKWQLTDLLRTISWFVHFWETFFLSFISQYSFFFFSFSVYQKSKNCEMSWNTILLEKKLTLNVLVYNFVVFNRCW